MIFRILNLAALLGAVAWWAKEGGWEPAVTSVGLLAGFLYQENEATSKKGPSRDEALYDKFLSEFPSTGRTVRFLKEHEFSWTFRAEELEDLERFLGTWQNAEHEFKNELLGSYLRDLVRKANQFHRTYCVEVFADPGGIRTMDLKDWEDRPEKLKAIETLNRLASEVYEAHQELVRQGRKLL